MHAIGIGPTLALRLKRSPASFDFGGGVLPVGATLVRGSRATRYSAAGLLMPEAADMPRFDYDPVTQAYRGLLIEPSATNVLPGSETLNSSAGWSGCGATADAAAAPDGATTADLLSSSSGTGVTSRRVSNPAVSIAPGPITASLHLRRGNVDWLCLTIGNSITSGASQVNNGISVWVNMTTGATGVTGYTTAGIASATPAAGWAFLSSSFSPAGAGFLRVSLSVITPADTAIVHLATAAGDGAQGRPDVGSGAGVGTAWYAWGAQIEAGPPTSYIATTAASAGRAADALSLNWASRGVGDGTVPVRYTFDNGSTQDVATVILGGSAAVPTTLNRPRIIRAAIA